MLNGYGERSSIPSYGPAVLRLAVGAVFIAHGAQKLSGLWGGSGLAVTSADFPHLGLTSATWLGAAGSLELLGGLLLVAGAYTLLATLALMLEIGVAMAQTQLAGGFFINWPLTTGVVHGYEFHLTLIAALLCLMLGGPGALSFDARRASHAAAEAAGRARLRAGTV